MIWLAVMYFCLSENDCNFWYKETLRPSECERVLGKAMDVMKKNDVPVYYGNCLPVKGSET